MAGGDSDEYLLTRGILVEVKVVVGDCAGVAGTQFGNQRGGADLVFLAVRTTMRRNTRRSRWIGMMMICSARRSERWTGKCESRPGHTYVY